MRVSAAGLQFIGAHEGCQLAAYQDTNGIWTIGYGHTATVQPGEKITKPQAMLMLATDTLHAANAVDALVDSHATQNQFDALASLAYNIGIGAFQRSTVLREHRAGNFQAAADAFLLWDKCFQDGGLVTIPGLLNRREDERSLYLSH